MGAPLEITEVELPAPGPGQVRVKLATAGVCHGNRDPARELPVLAGYVAGGQLWTWA